MDFPFIPRSEALELLEEDMRTGESRGEFLAEIGSSYFYGGASSSDASFLASMDLAQREQEFAMSEEGERYFARLSAARLYDDLASIRLSEWDVPELVVNPVGGYVASDGIAAGQWMIPSASYAHDPFTMLYGREVGRKFSPHHSDDIPF